MPLKAEEKLSHKQASQLVAKRLAKKRFPDEIMNELSQKGDMSWVRAEEIYTEVKEHRPGMISRAKAPGQIFSALIMIAIGGFAALVFGKTLEEWGQPTPFRAELEAIALPGDFELFYAYGGDTMIDTVVMGGALLFIAIGVLVMVGAILACLRP
jgi:hypothetical protein